MLYFISELISQFAFQLVVAELMFCLYLKKRSHAIYRVFFCFIPFITFYYYLSKTQGTDTPLIVLEIGFICTLFYSALGLWFIVQCTLQQLLFCVAGAYAVQNLNYNLYRIFQYCFKAETYAKNALCQVLCFILVYLLFYVVLINTLRHKNFTVMDSPRLILNSIFIFIMASFVSPVLPDNTTNSSLYFYIYAVTGDLLVLCVQFGLFNEGALKKQTELFEHLLYAERRHHEINKETIDLINMKCHDMRHQISLLKNFNPSKKQTEFIQQLEKNIQIYDNNVKTGNTTLDVVLMEKLLQCEHDQITLTYVANGSLLCFMDAYDIASLFGNALENAIESTLQQSPEDRNISFRVYAQGRLLKIQFNNYCSQKLNFTDGLPVSTKGDSRFHGYGVRSMQHLVKKYNGTLTVQIEDNIFSLNILIPIPAEA